ncbi:hypothetical protein ABZV53_44570, partial [Streptomyces sp900116325]
RRVLRRPQRELLSYGSSRSNDQGVHDQGETPRDEILNRAIARKIPTLPPKRTLLFNLDASFRFFESDLPLLYTVTVDAHGPFGQVDTLTYVIDLEVLRSTGLDRESLEWSTHVIAEQAEKSTNAQEKQASALKVLVEQVTEKLGSRTAPNPGPPALAPHRTN